MKKISLLIFTIFLFVSVSKAQNPTWGFDKVFKSSVTAPNAVQTDRAGNFWYASKTAEIGLNVIKLNGTPVMAPIMSVTFGGNTINTKTGCSGIQIAPDSTIVAIFNGNDMIRLNPTTGACLNYVKIPANGSNTEISDFGIDTLGNIYFTHVNQPAPIQIYGKNFVKIKDAVAKATNATVCKAITVTDFANWPIVIPGTSTPAAGIQIYTGRDASGTGIFHYRAFNLDSTFLAVDTLFSNYTNIEAFNWEKDASAHNKSTCWVSLASAGKLMKVDLGSDQKKKNITDSLLNTGSTGKLLSPKGVVFSAKSDTCLVIDLTGNQILQFIKIPFKPFNNWSFVKSVTIGKQLHGVIVDKDGKIWLSSYGGFDSTYNKINKHALTKSIIILNPDLTPKDTIRRITVGGITDTLDNSGRGFSADPDGNIMYSAFDIIYKINYKTYAGISKVVPFTGQGTTKTACDSYGNWVISYTLPPSGNGIASYDKDFNFLGLVDAATSPTLNAISRTIEMTANGNDVYHGSTAAVGLTHYHSDNGIYGPWNFVDYVGGASAYVDAEALAMDPSGKLWVGSNSRSIPRYDAWDLKTMKIVDNINPVAGLALTIANAKYGAIYTPRGIAFSKDGKTCYTVEFDAACIQVWTNTPTGVENKNVIPSTFQLSQNYPNPFNPTTNFKYSLPKASKIKMVVYDIFGREVKTLLNNEMKEAGSYTITWDGKNNMGNRVASGTYFYRMQTADFEKVMKMALIK
jgi:sugar lactone lactonase YvrE